MKCQVSTATRSLRTLTSTDLTVSLMSRLWPDIIRRRRCAICQGKNVYRYPNARYANRSVVAPRPRQQRHVLPERQPQDVGRVDSRHPPGELWSSSKPYAGNSPASDNLNDLTCFRGEIQNLLLPVSHVSSSPSAEVASESLHCRCCFPFSTAVNNPGEFQALSLNRAVRTFFPIC